MSESLILPTFTNKSDRKGGYSFYNQKAMPLAIIGGTALSAFVADIATLSLEYTAKQSHAIIPTNSLQYGLTYHSGDYVNGYLDAIVPAVILGYIASNMSYKKRLAISAGISTASVLLAEIPQLSGFRPDAINGFMLFGRADLADIPAGILGVMAFTGSTLLAGKMYHKKKVSSRI